MALAEVFSFHKSAGSRSLWQDCGWSPQGEWGGGERARRASTPVSTTIRPVLSGTHHCQTERWGQGCERKVCSWMNNLTVSPWLSHLCAGSGDPDCLSAPATTDVIWVNTYKPEATGFLSFLTPCFTRQRLLLWRRPIITQPFDLKSSSREPRAPSWSLRELNILVFGDEDGQRAALGSKVVLHIFPNPVSASQLSWGRESISGRQQDSTCEAGWQVRDSGTVLPKGTVAVLTAPLLHLPSPGLTEAC